MGFVLRDIQVGSIRHFINHSNYKTYGYFSVKQAISLTSFSWSFPTEKKSLIVDDIESLHTSFKLMTSSPRFGKTSKTEVFQMPSATHVNLYKVCLRIQNLGFLNFLKFFNENQISIFFQFSSKTEMLKKSNISNVNHFTFYLLITKLQYLSITSLIT